jgi:hypothetical protein
MNGKRRYKRRASALETCRNALRKDYLIFAGKHWYFRSRRFHAGTVNKLIDGGEAVRVGNCCVAWRHVDG